MFDSTHVQCACNFSRIQTRLSILLIYIMASSFTVGRSSEGTPLGCCVHLAMSHSWRISLAKQTGEQPNFFIPSYCNSPLKHSSLKNYIKAAGVFCILALERVHSTWQAGLSLPPTKTPLFLKMPHPVILKMSIHIHHQCCTCFALKLQNRFQTSNLHLPKRSLVNVL